MSFVLLLSCLYVHVDVIAEEEQDQPTVQEETEDTTQEQSDEAQGQSSSSGAACDRCHRAVGDPYGGFYRNGDL